jgi:hypothetical protein
MRGRRVARSGCLLDVDGIVGVTIEAAIGPVALPRMAIVAHESRRRVAVIAQHLGQRLQVPSSGVSQLAERSGGRCPVNIEE